MKMKKYEVVAIVLVVLYLISYISNPLYSMIISRLYGPKVIGALSLQHHIMTVVQSILRLLVSIAIAVWLGYQAKKDGDSPPIWALFGLFFSILGAILYFVLRNQKYNLSKNFE
jgi:hypothetical protein